MFLFLFCSCVPCLWFVRAFCSCTFDSCMCVWQTFGSVRGFDLCSFWFVWTFGSCSFGVCVFWPYTFLVSCAFGSCVCRDRGSCAVLIHGAFFSCKFGSRAVFLLCSFFVCAYIWLVCVWFVLCVCILLVYAWLFGSCTAFVCVCFGSCTFSSSCVPCPWLVRGFGTCGHFADVWCIHTVQVHGTFGSCVCFVLSLLYSVCFYLCKQ